MLAEEKKVELVLAPHPLKREVVHAAVLEGATLGELGLCPGIQAVVDGEIVTDYSFIPRAGQIVVLQRTLHGGGGKDNVRLIATIAVIALATYVAGPAGFGTATQSSAFAFGVTTLVGQLAIAALIPAPDLNLDAREPFEPFRTLAGTRNRISPFEAIPKIYGTHKIFPSYAVRPQPRRIGNQEYLYALFCVGYKPLNIDTTSFKIGDTLLSSYQNVDPLQVNDGFTRNDVIDLVNIRAEAIPEAVALNTLGTNVIRSFPPNTTRVAFDLSGVIGFDTGGTSIDLNVGFKFEYATSEAGPWTVILPSGENDGYVAAAYPYGVKTSASVNPNDVLTVGNYNPAGNPGTETIENAPRGYIRGNLTRATSGTFTVTFPSPGAWSVRLTRATTVLIVDPNRNSQLIVYTDETAVVMKYSNVSLTRVRRETDNSASPSMLNPKYAYVAFRIQATDQLSGIIDTFSCVAQSVLPTLSGTYSRTGTAVTVTITGHGLATNDKAQLDFTSGSATSGVYTVTVTNANVFTVTDAATGLTSGAVTLSVPTSNPAWCFRDVLRGTANARPVAAARMNTADLEAWAVRNASASREFNGIFDARVNVFEALKAVATAGRAAFSKRDATYSVVEDRTGLPYVQMFTPRNSWDFEAERAFARLPHALRVKFKNREAVWQEDQRVVYDDGYSLSGNKTGTYTRAGTLVTAAISDHGLATGVTAVIDFTSGGALDGSYVVTVVDANTFTFNTVASGTIATSNVTLVLTSASRFESLSLFGVTHKDQAWKDARFLLASGKLRPEVFTWKCAIENLIALRGDVVRLQYDEILVGLGSGRVLSATTTSVTCDEEFLVESGKTYQIIIRDINNVQLTRTVSNAAGTYKTLTFSTVVVVADVVGGLAAFGETGIVTLDVLVTGVRPLDDLTAEMTGLTYSSPGIHNSDGSAIPAYSANVTLPAVTPPAPTIQKVESGAGAGYYNSSGDFSPRILVSYSLADGATSVAKVESQYRFTGGSSSAWVANVVQDHSGSVIFDDIDSFRTYDLRLRSLTATGIGSPWAAVYGHVPAVRRQIGYSPTVSLVEQPNVPASSDGRNSTVVVTITPPSGATVWDHAIVQYRISGATAWLDAGRHASEVKIALRADGTVYQFRALSVDNTGMTSLDFTLFATPASITLKNLVGASPNGTHIATYLPASNITNLKLANVAGTSFVGRDIVFEWDNGVIPTYLHWKDYRVRVYTTGLVLLRTEYVTAARYRYTGEMNALDNAGTPIRSVIIDVVQRTLQDNVGA